MPRGVDHGRERQTSQSGIMRPGTEPPGQRRRLAEQMILPFGPDTVLVPWAGSRVTQTLAVQLSAAGLEASDDGLVITVARPDPGQVRDRLRELAGTGPADPMVLASRVENKAAAKYD